MALPEGGVNSSQVQSKQGGGVCVCAGGWGGGLGGWPLALLRSDQHLHPPLIKAEDPPCQDLGQKGAGSGDELCVSVIWKCPDPIVFFHGPKWTLPVLLITLGRAVSFHRGAWTKETLLCPSPSGPKITEKVPGKKKKAQLALSLK